MSHPIPRAIVVVLLLAFAPAFAQDGGDVGAKIREMQALVAKEFRQILREEMMLTDEGKQGVLAAVRTLQRRETRD
jgi:hypothetical protein